MNFLFLLPAPPKEQKESGFEKKRHFQLFFKVFESLFSSLSSQLTSSFASDLSSSFSALTGYIQ
jgi:hypothetical protein